MIKIISTFFLLVANVFYAQEADSLSVEVDTLEVENFGNVLINDKMLSNTFEKLRNIEVNKSSKLRIVHIGDSHIQADLVTDYLRQHFQNKFGNAGLGYAFPYKMAGTNGSFWTKFSSNINFDNYKNIKTPDTKPVGLSGIALYTNQIDFNIELKVKEKYKFNTVRVITPNNVNSFFVANDFTTSKELVEEKVVKKKASSHKIKQGEVLSKIAHKYKVSVTDLKRANNLKSDRINAGKTLIIPGQKEVYETVKKEIIKKDFVPLQQFQFPYSYDHYSQELIESIHLIPNKQFSEFALNGVILENEQPGITYSNIGINGAKCSDFNKYNLFYEQLPALQADLFIISLGTNESFDKLSAEEYKKQLNQMIDNIRTFNYTAEIIVTTPPPSQFKRKYKNTYEIDYTNLIIEQAEEKNYSVWDLYHVLGGSKKVNENYKSGLISSDKVHYTRKGYEKQADAFFEAIMQSYESFKSIK